MTYMNSNELPFSNHTGAYLVRPLGALEEFIWLLDQTRPAHFVMAAAVSGSTILSDWWRVLDFVQARHPLLSVRIARNQEDRPCFYQERTTSIPFHGALSSAFALAFWEVVDDLSPSPVRIMSPIDARKLLGLGEDCGVLVASGSVVIEPSEATTFWEIARSATARLGKAQTLEAIKAARYGMHQLMKQGLDVPTVAAVAARGYAHDIMLTNVGPLGYQTDFGELRLEAVWGPAFSARLLDAHTIGVATTNGSIRLLQTTFAPLGSLLETVEKILGDACATRKPVLTSPPSRLIRTSKIDDPSLC